MLNYSEDIFIFVIKFKHYSVILDIKWLQHHNSQIKWNVNFAIFNFSFYKSECFKTDKSAIIKNIFNISDILIYTNSLSASLETLTSSFNIHIIEVSFFNLFNNKADY